ncbi:MAG TPA: tetratricopeptide repeat protein, partial [Prolixibacteraceae bacterium]|nr:tetratricopeptide repeat protein [Prolixibacteraceae bacterium]
MKNNHLYFKVLSYSLIFFLGTVTLTAQDSVHPLSLRKAIDLYQSANYIAAEKMCHDLLLLTSPDDPLAFDLHYYRLMALVKQNDRNAESDLSAYLEEHPGSPWKNQLMFELGRLQFSNRRYKQAVRSFENTDPSLLSQNDRDDYTFYTGYSYFESGNLKKASHYFFDIKKSSSLYASSASYYWGYINYLDGNYETALQEFSKLENDKKFSGFISYYTIQIYYLQEKYDRVIEKGEKIVTAAPVEQRNELYKILGDALFETGNYIRAVQYLDTYQGVKGKKSREDFYRLAICYDQIGEYDKAVDAFNKVTVQNDLLAQNAFYHMAGCYLKKNDKKNARAAFQQASSFSFDPKIEEDALFNYAKLSYELSYSPFNETIRAFDQYIAKYPDSDRNDAAFDYLVKVYMTTRNYQEAIRSIEQIRVKTPSINEAYQRVTLYRGLELFNDGHYASALPFFDKSIENSSYNPTFKAQALYWKAEANYRLERYNEALEGFTAFQATPGAFTTPEFSSAYYNTGYCFFNQKRYTQAAEWFRKYLNQSRKEPKKTADGYNRVADCLYLDRDYEQALVFYTRSYELNQFDPDYALYQRAICNGLLRRYEPKIADLSSLIDQYPRSSFTDDAYFELARTYERTHEEHRSVDYYTRLVSQFPKSPLNKKAWLQMGIISYNQNELDASLGHYKQLIEKYPDTEEARAALVGIKNIYIDRNKVDDYFAYVASLNLSSESSESAQDSVFYIAAEKQYMSGATDSDR